jgi:rhodanese-related sulfurtransferase
MRLLKEILFILIGSAFVAFLFNYNQTNPLPLIKSEKKIIEISDSLLFGDEHNKPVNQKVDSVKNTKIYVIDSLKKKIDNPNNTVPTLKSGQDSIKPNSTGISSANSNLEKSITYKQLLKIMDNPKFLLIDARNPENFIKAKIGKAINIFPYGDEKEMMNKILDLPRDKTLIVYCDGGNCDASHKLAEIIIGFGYEKVFIYTGGWEEWTKKSGLKD